MSSKTRTTTLSADERWRRFKWRKVLVKKIRRRLRKPGKTAPPPPKSNTTIWRYMSRRAFLQLVTERRLTFHRFKELQNIDAREGMVVPGFWRSVWEYKQARLPFPVDLGASRQINEAILDRLRCLTYANCWNMAKQEDNLMWKAYAPKGIAIRTTIANLRMLLNKAGMSDSPSNYKRLFMRTTGGN